MCRCAGGCVDEHTMDQLILYTQSHIVYDIKMAPKIVIGNVFCTQHLMVLEQTLSWHNTPQVDRRVRPNGSPQSPLFWVSYNPGIWCCTPRRIAGGRTKRTLGNFGFCFWFVFRTPIAKNRVELFGGPASGFEIRPVSARLLNGRQHLPPTPQRYAL